MMSKIACYGEIAVRPNLRLCTREIFKMCLSLSLFPPKQKTRAVLRYRFSLNLNSMKKWWWRWLCSLIKKPALKISTHIHTYLVRYVPLFYLITLKGISLRHSLEWKLKERDDDGESLNSFYFLQLFLSQLALSFIHQRRVQYSDMRPWWWHRCGGGEGERIRCAALEQK
jgi:hypothetical protein